MLSVLLPEVLLFFTVFRYSQCYLCDVDNRCDLKTDRKLCVENKESCKSGESLQGFVDSDGLDYGIKNLQGKGING